MLILFLAIWIMVGIGLLIWAAVIDLWNERKGRR